MSLESASLINQLVTSNPTSQDPKSQGPAHMRGIKTAIKNTFPNLSSEMSATAGDLNKFKVGGTVSGNLTIKGNVSASGSIVAVSVILPDNDATATGNISYSTAIGALKIGDGSTEYKINGSNQWAKFYASASDSDIVLQRLITAGSGATIGNFLRQSDGYDYSVNANSRIVLRHPGVYKIGLSVVLSGSISTTFSYRLSLEKSSYEEYAYNIDSHVGLFGRITTSISGTHVVSTTASSTISHELRVLGKTDGTLAWKASKHTAAVIVEKL